MPSNYPGALDNFAESSPTYMSDPDATGRVHSARHDDVEAAVEQIEETLGVNPQGSNGTVANRLAGLNGAGNIGINTGPAPGDTVYIQGGQGKTALRTQSYASGNGLWIDNAGAGDNWHSASNHYFQVAGLTIAQVSAPGLSESGRRVATHYWDESVGRRLFVWDTNNARWQMVYGDTGWRKMTPENGWAANDVHLRRIGNTIHLLVWEANKTNATSDTLISLPFGYAAALTMPPGWVATNQLDPVLIGFTGAGAGVGPLRDSLTKAGAQSCNGMVSWSTTQTWPLSLPGTAVGDLPTLLPGDDPSRGVIDVDLDVDPDIPTGLSPDDDTSGWTVEYPEGPVTP